MNPDVPQHGRSFRAAWLYYFHDKRRPGEAERLTDERVAFTETVNLPTDDPEKAWKWMAYTAMHQAEIKRANGGDMRGRKMQRPLYAYSLNWHPSEDPSREHMLRAAHDSLKRMGLEGYEAMIAAHMDRDHPHVHVLVNKVHPETGRGPNLSNDYHRLQKWAYEYERQRGKIFCRRREFNIVAREQEQATGQRPQPTPDQRKAIEQAERERQTKAEYHRWQRARIDEEIEKRQSERETLSARHRHARKMLSRAREARIEKAREAIKEKMRPRWRALYRRQRQEMRELNNASKNAWQRLNYWLKNRRLDRAPDSATHRRGFLARAYDALRRSDTMHEALRRMHAKERQILATKQRDAARSALRVIKKTYTKELTQLKEQQERIRHEMDRRHMDEERQGARDIKSGRAFAQFKLERDWENPSGRPPSDSRSPSSKRQKPGPEPDADRSKTREDWDEARDASQSKETERDDRSEGLDRTRDNERKGPELEM